MSLFENLMTVAFVLSLFYVWFAAIKWTASLAKEMQHYRDKKARLDFFHRLAAAEYERAVKALEDGDSEAVQDAHEKHNLLHLRFQRELADYYSRKS